MRGERGVTVTEVRGYTRRVTIETTEAFLEWQRLGSRPGRRRANAAVLKAPVLVGCLTTITACGGLLGIDDVKFVDGDGDDSSNPQGVDSSDHPLPCGEAGACAVRAGEVCCWEQLYAISECTQGQCIGNPLLCDNGTACSTAGKPGDLCCATLMNCEIQSSSCAPQCEMLSTDCNMTDHAVLCDHNVIPDPCTALDAGLACQPYVAAPGIYYACQP
jgi:hypothetical protein